MPIESEKVLVWSDGTEVVSSAVLGAGIPEDMATMMEENKTNVNWLLDMKSLFEENQKEQQIIRDAIIASHARNSESPDSKENEAERLSDVEILKVKISEYRQDKWVLLEKIFNSIEYRQDLDPLEDYQHTIWYSILEFLGTELNIRGHIKQELMDFVQEVYCDIIEYTIDRLRVRDDSYFGLIIDEYGSLLDAIEDSAKKFTYLSHLSRYTWGYRDFLLDAYQRSFRFYWSEEFCETMRNKQHTNLSDTLSFLFILEYFIGCAEYFQEDEAYAYLRSVEADILKSSEKLALIKYVAEGRWDIYQNSDEEEDRDDEDSPWMQIASDKALYNPENILPQGVCDTSDCRNIDRATPHEPYHSLFSDIHELHDAKNGEDYTFLLQLLHRPEIMAQIEHAIGIRFADYPFSIQPHFLSFLAYATVDDMERMRTYLAHAATTEEKFARLRTFLATGEKREFGDLILRIDTLLTEYYGEQDGARLGNGLFGKYAEIMAVIEEDAEQIQGEYYGADSGARFSKQSYVRELMKRANDVLEDIARMLESHPPLARIEKAIGEYDAELVQYGSLFRITEKESGLSLDAAMENLGIVHKAVPGNKMDKEQKRKVWNLYEINYADHPSRDTILPLNQSRLDADYENPDASFHLFEHKGKCLLTAKFVTQPDGSVYFGAFNTELQFQPYGFGVFVLDKLLSEYDDRIIHGHVLKGSEHLLRYYKRYGLEPEKAPDGSPVVKNIWWVELYHVVREVQTKEK